MTERILVAGVGNVLLRRDDFAVDAARLSTAGPQTHPVLDAHSLTPDAIFRLLSSLGGHPGRSLVVACEPADIDAGMGLSDPARAALPHAFRAVEEILAGAAPAGQQADEQPASPGGTG